jgi:uncharacterized membrane protein (UPF0127 family)
MKPLRWILSMVRDHLTPSHHEPQDIRLRVANLERGTLLATRMEVADTSPKRNKGLLGRNYLAPGEGLWILPCDAVHTFGMRFPIDLIYLDRKNKIKKLLSNVPPWRLSACLPAHSILELPAGTIRDTETYLGDTLEFSAVAVSDDSIGEPSADEPEPEQE